MLGMRACVLRCAWLIVAAWVCSEPAAANTTNTTNTFPQPWPAAAVCAQCWPQVTLVTSASTQTCGVHLEPPGTNLYCTATGLTLVPVFDPLLHADLFSINLVDNKISRLTHGVFIGANATKELWLDRNEITEIQAGAFIGLDQVTNLQLQENKITMLPDGVFAPMLRLFSLLLWSNNLRTLSPDVFLGTTFLAFLRLNQNELTEIKRDTFKHLKDSLYYLYVASPTSSCPPLRTTVTHSTKCPPPSIF